jgi:hypothetical protein
MDFWRLYEVIVTYIHKHMVERDQCLYNATVKVLGEMTWQDLLDLRDHTYDFVRMIESEMEARIADAEDATEENEERL